MHTLVIGLNSDEDIRSYKGPTVLSGAERVEIIRALKWGDETIADTPYEPSVAIFDQFNCEYYIHGDDPVMINGVNVCQTFNEMGRFKEIRRTTGVSTTDLTGKLLKLLEQDDAAQSSEENKTDAEFFGQQTANGVKTRKLQQPKQTFL